MERNVRQRSIYPLLLIWLLFLASCKPHVDPVEPKLTTSTPGNITATAASSGGIISDDGGASVTARGVCWNTSAGPTITNSKTSDGSGTGSFSSSIAGLSPGTTYYVRAYATNSTGTGYGNEVSFKTLAIAPALTTNAVTVFAASTATAGGNITGDGGGTVTSRGVCWSTNQNPTIADAKTSDGSGIGSFTSSMAGLNPGTTYYIRAYATNSAGTGYGNEVSFKTLSVAPTLTTNAITVITAATATSGGNITTDGGGAVSVRGVCWSTTQNPTTANSKTTDGTGSGSFTSSIAGLNPGTVYYVRAFATNSTGTGYGNEVSFTTLAKVPTLTTSTISSITTTTAASGGNITSDGGGAITARGVCWSTTQNPTTASSRSSDGSGSGTYTSLIAGLSASTTYYVRAYATNSAGTGYGDQLSFITSKVLTLATVTTSNASNITTTSATIGGNVTNDGNATVTERGFVYGIVQNPTIANNKIAVGNGTGNFTTNLTGLANGTSYFARTYAINSQGTAYGNQITFKTTASTVISLATVLTVPVSAISTTGATLGGNVTNNGNATITERGFVYGTSQNPTTSDTKAPVGNGGAAFTTYITGLSAGTSYYVRAYAINSVGTAYGNQITFDTPLTATVATVITIPPSNITSTSARGGGYIISDGGAAVTSSGICWSTNESPTTSDSKISGASTTGQFGGQINGLTDGTTYYVRAFAINSAGTSYGNQVSFITSQPVKTDPVSDVDGNTYRTVAIGEQVWMAENLRTTKYNDGTNIPLVADSANWRRLITPGYCWYDNDKNNKRPYGALYNWFTVDTWKLCPEGWSVPSDDQWNELTTFLGGENIAGARLKETGTTHWSSPNLGVGDSFGFTALPGGGRGAQSVFGLMGNDGNWWTSTEQTTATAWYRIMRYNQIAVGRNAGNKRSGFSVRCIKDY